MLSVNTNYSAMIALQNLNFTNTELEGVQNKISTGLKISSARENARSTRSPRLAGFGFCRGVTARWRRHHLG